VAKVLVEKAKLRAIVQAQASTGLFPDHVFSPIKYSSATKRTAGASISTKFSSSLRIIAGTAPANIKRMSSIRLK
jgi:hypothetical protein